ncbi:MAG: M15 family peptidase [Sulfurovum sp.]|nr:M15 family peptidase [Sulfurovum sp.]
MRKTILFLSIISVFTYGSNSASISSISKEVKQRMIKGNSWRKGCPVALKDLRYLRLPYLDFKGQTRLGEMIVHKEVASEVNKIFVALYDIKYPIRKMRLVSDYKGSDWQSIESDNTSAFNCRNATGSKKWSKHSYGKAIDLNSIENPYISRSGHISHKASLKYRQRKHQNSSPADKALLLKNDKVVKLFKKYGWRWGGDWSGVKDYQHFSK